MFSVYLSKKVGNTTHLKFGGYDKEGIEGGLDNLQFLRTNSDDTWRLQMHSARVGNDMIELEIDRLEHPRFAIFELAYPYIYVPMDDFNVLAEVINAQYSSSSIACLQKAGRCLF